jgi:hypothetical protein
MTEQPTQTALQRIAADLFASAEEMRADRPAPGSEEE